MIAFTQTLSTWGGNFYVSKGLGFLYNDHFRGGRGGTGYGSMLPLMRSSSTSVPTLVFAPSARRARHSRRGSPWVRRQRLDSGVGLRHHPQRRRRRHERAARDRGAAIADRQRAGGGSRVQIEDRIPRAVLRDLEARGHTFAKVGRKGEVKYGYAAVAVVNAAKGTVEGGAEPRRVARRGRDSRLRSRLKIKPAIHPQTPCGACGKRYAPVMTLNRLAGGPHRPHRIADARRRPGQGAVADDGGDQTGGRRVRRDLL